MKKLLRNLLITLAITPFIVQCASQEETNRLTYQIRVLNNKIENMKKDTMSDMQKRQAVSSDKIDQLQNEIQNLKGQLEETAHMNRILTEQNKELESSFKSYSAKSSEEREAMLKQYKEQEKLKEAKLAELSNKLSALQAAKIREAERRAKQASRRAAEARAKANQAGYNLHKSNMPLHITAEKKKTFVSGNTHNEQTNVKNTSSSASQAKAKKTKSEVSNGNDAFSLAMADYNKRHYAKAFKQFERFIGKNETGKKSIEARYMMGECLFQQKDFDQAILQYQKIVSNYPQSPKTPSALLRQGMAFEKLSDKDTAKIIYKKILNEYSGSPEAVEAKQKLGSL